MSKSLKSKVYDDWFNSTYTKTTSRFPERKEEFKTSSGHVIDPVYSDEGDINGFPGAYPYTRGVQPTMYRGRFWTMRQYAGFGNAEESNKRYRYLLDNGQSGLSVAFDLPTQIGYDSDNILCAGEVGKVGVAIDTLKDMEILFNQIPLDKVSTSMTINAPASVLLAFYIATAEKQGVDKKLLSGTIQNDILKEYIARGTYIFPTEPSMRLITDIFSYCSKEVPKWNTISISGYHIREAGSSASQEIGFTIADAIAYVEAAIKAGLDVDDFAPRLSFFFNAHNDLLEEVAKFRAARRIWSKIMKERFNAQKPKSMMLRFHTQTGGSTLTAQQPENNIVRVTIQALAAVLGGTQSLHTNSKDEALALPTEDSVRVALRTQQIIANESGVANTADPLGGSYYIESLTDRIEQDALALINEVDKIGGMPKAIEIGFPQKEIQRSSYEYQKSVESGESIVVGVNKFQIEEQRDDNLLKVDAKVEKDQIDKLTRVKAERNNQNVSEILEQIRKASRTSENLMPLFLRAAKEYTSLGEICSVLREEFGEYRENIVL